MVKKTYRGIDVYFLLLIVCIFCVYTYLFIISGKGMLGEYVLVFLLFILIIISYFTNILIALVASSIIVFVFGLNSIYLSFAKDINIDNGYFWIIIYPVGGLLAGQLGDRVLTLVDKCKDLEARVATYLSYDELTGFGNTMALYQYLRKILSSANRHNYNVAILVIEVKYYKGLKAKYGNEKFQRILRSFSGVIHENLRIEDSPFRVEDNIFIIVLENTDEVGAGIVKRRMKDRFIEPINIEMEDGELSVKINTRMSVVMYDAEMDENQLIELGIKELEYDVE